MKTFFVLLSVLIARAQYVPVPFTHAAAGASMSFVASSAVTAVATGTTSSLALTLNSQPTSTQGVVVFIANITSAITYSFAGAGCTWVKNGSDTTTLGGRWIDMWTGFACSGSGGTTVTASYSSTAIVPRMLGFLVNNPNSSSPTDGFAGTMTVTTNTITTGTVTPSVSTGLCGAAAYRSSGSGGGTVGSPWTLLDTGLGGSNATPAAFNVPGSTSAQQAAFTFGGAPDSGSGAVIGCLKP